MWLSNLQIHLHWSSVTMASCMNLDDVSEEDDSWADEPQTTHARKGCKGKGTKNSPKTRPDGKPNMKESTLERTAHALNLKMNLSSHGN